MAHIYLLTWMDDSYGVDVYKFKYTTHGYYGTDTAIHDAIHG